ncbi:hypothetical protein HanIR_Chr12g0591831 [Helianthus annuus]|nr:hypothetical protein HanIR_Chr12g0591831 [Helianthus annuus]
MPRHQPLVLAALAPPRVRGQKYKGGSRRFERAKCKVRHQSATLRLIAHATRVRGKGPQPLASTLSECFHETIRMEGSHLNTPLSSISHPMWDKVLPSHFFQHSSFKHQTLSIDISFILASFWTWFSSLRNSSDIEHKPTNKYIKPAHFIIFISSPKIGKNIFLYL